MTLAPGRVPFLLLRVQLERPPNSQRDCELECSALGNDNKMASLRSPHTHTRGFFRHIFSLLRALAATVSAVYRPRSRLPESSRIFSHFRLLLYTFGKMATRASFSPCTHTHLFWVFQSDVLQDTVTRHAEHTKRSREEEQSFPHPEEVRFRAHFEFFSFADRVFHKMAAIRLAFHHFLLALRQNFSLVRQSNFRFEWTKCCGSRQR